MKFKFKSKKILNIKECPYKILINLIRNISLQKNGLLQSFIIIALFKMLKENYTKLEMIKGILFLLKT